MIITIVLWMLERAQQTSTKNLVKYEGKDVKQVLSYHIYWTELYTCIGEPVEIAFLPNSANRLVDFLPILPVNSSPHLSILLSDNFSLEDCTYS